MNPTLEPVGPQGAGNRIMKTELDSFTRGYIECALWAGVAGPDDSLKCDLPESALDPDTRARMVSDCQQFQEENREALDECGLGSSRAGHDFWLTRNRHGSGFWDEGSEPVFRKLTDAALAWGAFDLSLGNDGKIRWRRWN